MQLANLRINPSWCFLFGAAEKSSLAHQYASEHKLAHVKADKIDDYAFADHVNEGLVIECPATLFRQVESLKPEIQVAFLGKDLSAEEIQIKKDYLKIGKCAYLEQACYKSFRRAVYPKIIALFGPCPIQNRFLKENYFNFTGYHMINNPLTANDMISKLPKDANYILTSFIPEPSELTVLDEYFDFQVIHLKHERTELSNQEAFFDLEARIVPELSKREYFFTLNTNTTDLNITEEIGTMILPSLVFINANNKEEMAGAQEYIEKSESILLDMPDLMEVLNRKGIANITGLQLISLLVNIIWKNADKDIIFFSAYPTKPEEFSLLQEKTRSFSLFADCVPCEKYQPSMTQNPSIFFLETHRHKHFDSNCSFQQQFRSSIKYFIVAGAQGVGKTSVAKYMCSRYGYKHIECETYVAGIKQKLMEGVEGEDIPFPRLLKHFTELIQNCGDTPLVIDGIGFDWKDIEKWVEAAGPPIIINLKADQKQITKRYRKKTDGDVNGEITEDDMKAASEKLAKNAEWVDQFGSRCPSSTIYQIDFSPQLILAEKLIDDILKPRIFLIQTNQTTLFQNIAIRYNMGFYDLRRETLEDVAVGVRLSEDRNIIISNYSQNYNLACADFFQIERKIGPVRYLAIWHKEETESKEEEMKLEPPPKEEKPKPAEGEEGDAPPPEEEGEPKKKALDIYEHKWTKPGMPKNVSQWFFSEKKNISKKEVEPMDCFNCFGEVIEELAKGRDACVYHTIAMK